MIMRLALLVALLSVAPACGDPSDDDDGGGVATRICDAEPCDTPHAVPTRATPTPYTPAPSPTSPPSTAEPEPPVPTSAPPTSTSVPSTTGTLMGYVHIGPTCPVVRQGENCDDRPHEAALEVVDAGGAVIMTVRSDANGNFNAMLPVGDYLLVPGNDGRLPYANEQSFAIESGRVTHVDVAYDSGIR
jgi:hypothetical protein